MTTKQTIDGVSRRMLTALLCHVSELENRALVDELRALLDAPAVESELARMTRRCQNAELALKVQTENYEALKAAQPQGEPVAWRVTGRGGLTLTPEYPKWATGKGSEGLKVEALVVEQSAPVAVDDNVEFEKWWMSTPILRKQKIQIAQEAWFARAKLSK